ncbi:MAG: hypothetical protein ACI9UA_004161 [Pseudoalteromonas tetraodonis]|jgi:hypothetical protein
MNPTSSGAPLVENTNSASLQERSREYAIYKPNSRGSGGVIRFGLNLAKQAIFVDAASQSGPRQFDWEKKFTMKWGLSDLGSVLVVLQGRTDEAKLFHKTDYANSAFELVAGDDPEMAPFLMSVSRQEASDKSVRKVSIPVTFAEAAVLAVALEAAVVRLVGW